MGRWWRIFNISISMAMGTVNNTMDCKELTMLNGNTDQTGMSSQRTRNMIYRLDERH